jgi:hypothetical protein
MLPGLGGVMGPPEGSGLVSAVASLLLPALNAFAITFADRWPAAETN